MVRRCWHSTDMKTLYVLTFALALAAVPARAWFSTPMLISGSSGPAPTAVAPSAASVSDTAPANTVFATASCTVASGTCSFSISGQPAFVSLSGNSLQTSQTLTPANDGTYTFTLCAIANGLSFCGGNNNFILTVIAGGAVACDYGPNTTLPTGTVGTDLAAAGFTHCALNANFTDSSGTTGGNGWVMNNLATYVGACGTDAWGKIWFKWVNGAGSNGDSAADAPCNRLSLVADGSVPQVLSFQFANADIVKGSSQANSRIGLGLWWPLCGNACASMKPALPTAHYMEFTYRMTGLSQSPGQIIDASEASIFDNDNMVQPNQQWFDFSMLEGASSGFNSNLSLDHYQYDSSGVNLNKNTANFSYVPDLGNYHTSSYLTTTNASTEADSCFYYDGANATKVATSGWTSGTSFCSHWLNWNNTGTGPLSYHDDRVWKFIGAFQNFPFTNASLSNTLTIFLKSIRVFTCNTYTGLGNNCTTAQSGGSLVYH
jgi:hypothetical protein